MTVKRLLDSGPIRAAIIAYLLWFAHDLTRWAMAFASSALASKAEMSGVAAVIVSTSAAPIAILTLLTNKYLETRKDAP